MITVRRAALALLAALALTLTLATGALAQPGGGTEDPPPVPCGGATCEPPLPPGENPPPPPCEGGETPPPPAGGNDEPPPPCPTDGENPTPPPSSPFAQVFERMNAAVERIPEGPARQRAEARVSRVQNRLCQAVPRFC